MSTNQSSPTQQPDEVRREERILTFAIVGVLVAAVVIAVVGFLFLRRPADIIEGQADATSIRISGKLPGRVATLYVREGDMVRAGDTLVHIHSSVVDAKLAQAEAMREAAAASNRAVDAGARKQTIQAARDLVAQAEAPRVSHARPMSVLRLSAVTVWCRSRSATRRVLPMMLPWRLLQLPARS